MKYIKTVPATYNVKSDEVSGGWIVEGYASVFDAKPDSYGDVVKRNSFKKTIQEQAESGRPRFFWDHQQPLGKILSLEEDGKGLKVRARISQTTLGNDVKTLVEDQAVGEFSYGYDLVEGEGKNKRNQYGGIDITEVKLYEVSLVGMASLPEAVVTGVKSLQFEQSAIREELAALKSAIPGRKEFDMDSKAASGSTDLPLADEGMSWDSSAAEKTVASWAEGEDGETDRTDYGKAFFWQAESPEGKQDFKLPFGQVIEGTLKAVPAGVKAAAAAIQGSRGGVGIPEADLPGVKAKIETYYGKLEGSPAPPWATPDREDDSGDEGKAAEDAMDEGGGEAPTAAEVTAALRVIKALADTYWEPSEDTPEEDSEPPKALAPGSKGEAEEKFLAELDGMKTLQKGSA